MNPPEYYIQEMIQTLDDPKIGWYYKNQIHHESFFGGEAYKTLRSNIDIPENEMIGTVRGIEFFSTDLNYTAILPIPLQETKAIAIKCIDGVVVVPQISFKYRDNRQIEGYWYSEYSPQYPKPIPNILSEQEAKEIFNRIKQKEAEAEMSLTRGFSPSRIDGTVVGNGEYQTENWIWPEGFAEHYVLKYKVKPTDDFLEYIGSNYK